MSAETETPPLNSHARFARRAADALGWSWRSLDGADAYLFEVSDGMRRAVLGAGSASPYALNSAASYSLARDKAFANAALAAAGVPIIASKLFFVTDRRKAHRAPGRELADARAFAARAQYPLFCKPNSGARGELAELIADAAAFEDYLGRAAALYEAILAQPFVAGREYRVCALEGAALFAYAKRAPTLVGDGVASIATLYQRHVRALATATTPAPLSNARFVDARGAFAQSDHVPAFGEELHIAGRANRAAGGAAEGFTTEPPARLAALALRCADALRLGLAGVDLFDVSPARDLSDLVVIEVNASPAFETLEALGRFDLIDRIWTANLKAALA
jgi:glutathione synthase/RimK-type ligase-like ATP-grasp enzyme